MKILVTFEYGGIVIHAIDIFRYLIYMGHSVDVFVAGNTPLYDPLNMLLSSNVNIITSVGTIDDYDIWMYDLTTWDSPKSPFTDNLEKFRGKLICINYEDGNHFFEYRVSEKVVEKTILYTNNSLWKDTTKYDERIRHKLFLTTSYITNSQDFKNVNIPFEKKHPRAIFTGNITGFTESGDREEYKCRVDIPMKLIRSGVPCFFRIYGYDPSLKWVFDDHTPSYYKSAHLSRSDFINEMLNSMAVLAIRGNGYTINRYFEGLASGGLVFAIKSDHSVNFIGRGEPGTHYVEIKWDGSDVVDRVNYYLSHLDEAKQIAQNGRKLWEEYSMLDDKKLPPQKILDYYTDGFLTIGGINLV